MPQRTETPPALGLWPASCLFLSSLRGTATEAHVSCAQCEQSWRRKVSVGRGVKAGVQIVKPFYICVSMKVTAENEIDPKNASRSCDSTVGA